MLSTLQCQSMAVLASVCKLEELVAAAMKGQRRYSWPWHWSGGKGLDIEAGKPGMHKQKEGVHMQLLHEVMHGKLWRATCGQAMLL